MLNNSLPIHLFLYLDKTVPTSPLDRISRQMIRGNCIIAENTSSTRTLPNPTTPNGCAHVHHRTQTRMHINAHVSLLLAVPAQERQPRQTTREAINSRNMRVHCMGRTDYMLSRRSCARTYSAHQII